jgi:hypothetical protein
MEVGVQITRCIKARYSHAPARCVSLGAARHHRELIVALLRMRNGSAQQIGGKPDKSSVPASTGRHAALFLIVH